MNNIGVPVAYRSEGWENGGVKGNPTMIIKLNGEDVQWDPQSQADLGGLLEEFVAKRFFRDEFISTIKINGEEIPENVMLTMKTKPVADVRSIEIATDTFRAVSIRALDSMDEYVEGLAALVEQSADKFRTDDETTANRNFINCVEGLQTFVGIIDKVKNINGLDFEAMKHDGGTLNQKEQKLLQVLNTLFTTQKNRDWISLADILEYELAPLIAEWKEILRSIANNLRGM